MRIGIDIHHLRLDQRGIYYYLWNTLSEVSRIDSGHSFSLWLFGPSWMTDANRMAQLRGRFPNFELCHAWDGPSPRLLSRQYQPNGAKPPRWARGVDRKLLLPLYRKALAFDERHPRKGRWFTGFWHEPSAAKCVDVFHHPAGLIFPVHPKANVMTIHDLFPLHYPDYNAEASTYFTESYAHAVAMDVVIADSDYTKDDIINRLGVSPDRIRVISQAAHPQYRPIEDDDVIGSVLSKYHLVKTKYILCVGAMERRKNIDRLVEAYARLRQTNPALKHQLALAGGGDPKVTDDIQKLVVQHGLTAHVAMLGYVPFEDLPYLICGADLFVFPSLFEGFGLPPLEAMSCGTPVVASNTTSVPEVVGDAGMLVDPTNVDAMARAMNDVLNDRKLHRELREKGLARARTFTWEHTARQTVTAYEHAWDRWRSEGSRPKPTPPRTKYQTRLHEWVLEQTREHMYNGTFAKWCGTWP